MDERRLPIGIQTFEKLRTTDCIYVDKTDLVYKLANGNTYNYLSRPRRFGKSLLLSTLQAYFEGRKYLFEGLAIENLEKKWTQHSVIRFDFNNGEYQRIGGAEDIIDYQLRRYEQSLGIDSATGSLTSRFETVIIKAYEQSGRGVVILVDEYEKPVLEAIGNSDLQNAHRAILKPFYATIKSCDQYIRFVMLTGVTKMGHLSVFSDLNNVVNHSLSPEMSAICGFTKEQIPEYFGEYLSSLSLHYHVNEGEIIEKLRNKYDGYRFSRTDTKVFNPYSLLNAFRTNELSDFWFETGSPSFLVNVLRTNRFKLNNLDGISVRSKFLTEIDDDFSNPIALLYQSGYLTIKDYNPTLDQYTLGYPNEEVKRGFLESLIPNYATGDRTVFAS